MERRVNSMRLIDTRYEYLEASLTTEAHHLLLADEAALFEVILVVLLWRVILTRLNCLGQVVEVALTVFISIIFVEEYYTLHIRLAHFEGLMQVLVLDLPQGVNVTAVCDEYNEVSLKHGQLAQRSVLFVSR